MVFSASSTVECAEDARPLRRARPLPPPLPPRVKPPADVAVVPWRTRWFKRTVGSSATSAVLHGAAIIGLGLWLTGATDSGLPAPELLGEMEQEGIEPEFTSFAVAIEADETNAAAGSGGGGAGQPGAGGGSLAMMGLPGGDVKLTHSSRVGRTGIFGDDGMPAEALLGGLGEGAQGANFFGIDAEGNTFVFVVDMSGSMGRGDRLRRAKIELKRAITALMPGQRFYIIFFNDYAFPMPGTEPIDATKPNFVKMNQWVSTALAGGGTNPAPALEIALGMKPDAVFLLTDGVFPPQSVAYAVGEFIEAEIPVHTIAFVSPEGAEILRQISSETHGKHHYVP